MARGIATLPCCLLAVIFVLDVSVAQPPPPNHDGMGQGVAKSSMACSKNVATNAKYFMKKYMPLTLSDDDCRNHVCKCGIQSRMETKSSFGLHCTLAYGTDHAREQANGGMTIEEVEAQFSSMIGDWSGYDADANVRAWSDYHTQFFHGGDFLDSLIEKFEKDSVKFHSGQWLQNGNTFYSVLFQVPASQVVVEIWSGQCKKCGSSKFAEARQRRATQFAKWARWNDFFATGVSRAVDDLTVIKDFYKKAFGISPADENSLDDGSEYVDINFGTEVDVRYIKRAGQTGQKTTSWYQSNLVNVSKTYMTGVKACWPIWGDNHFAYDGMYKTAEVLSGAERSTFGSFFKPVKAGPMEQAYMLEPSGYQIQLDGNYNAPQGTEGFDPEYCSTSCKATAPSENTLMV